MDLTHSITPWAATLSINNNLEDTTMQQCDHITILSIYTGSVSLITLLLIPVKRLEADTGTSQYLHRSATVGVAAQGGAEHCGCRDTDNH